MLKKLFQSQVFFTSVLVFQFWLTLHYAVGDFRSMVTSYTLYMEVSTTSTQKSTYFQTHFQPYSHIQKVATSNLTVCRVVKELDDNKVFIAERIAHNMALVTTYLENSHFFVHRKYPLWLGWPKVDCKLGAKSTSQPLSSKQE